MPSGLVQNPEVAQNVTVDLLTATASGSYSAVQAVLYSQDIATMQAQNSVYTSLVTSIYQDKLNIADLIVSVTQTNINQQSVDGNSPLMFAALWGREQLAKFLLDKGADYTLMNSSGDTALSLALKNGQNSVALLLRQYGATF